MVVHYLAPYGYEAAGPEDWKALPAKHRARLELSLDGHSEASGHTLYGICCKLSHEGGSAAEAPLRLAWSAERRLSQIREGLHDLAKSELGKGYGQAFSDAPFAKRGGPGGTSERLQRWLQTLAQCINEGAARPALVTQVFLFLDAPAQLAHRVSAETLDSGADALAPEGLEASCSSVEAAAAPAATTAQEELKVAELAESVPPTDAAATTDSTKVIEFGAAALPALAESVEEEPYLEPSGPKPWAQFSDIPPGDAATTAGAVAAFLEPYGYLAASLDEWRIHPHQSARKPQLRLAVEGHTKQGGRTLYRVNCRFVARGPPLRLDWVVERQLGQLREELHDVAKAILGTDYLQAFSDAPFAMRAGPSGTTGRLARWLEALATSANQGSASPALVAQVLVFLAPPAPGLAQSSAASARLPLRRSASVEASRRRTSGEGSEGVEAVKRRCRSESPVVSRLACAGGAGNADELSTSDEEGAAWPAEKRYKKLQAWFAELKKVLERKVRRDERARASLQQTILAPAGA